MVRISGNWSLGEFGRGFDSGLWWCSFGCAKGVMSRFESHLLTNALDSNRRCTDGFETREGWVGETYGTEGGGGVQLRELLTGAVSQVS